MLVLKPANPPYTTSREELPMKLRRKELCRPHKSFFSRGLSALRMSGFQASVQRISKSRPTEGAFTLNSTCRSALNPLLSRFLKSSAGRMRPSMRARQAEAHQ